MASFLQPLAPLGAGGSGGLSPDLYAEVRRRQSLADALANDATSASGAGGTALGAIGQGLKGWSAGGLRAQNGADIAAFGQASPSAASALGAFQPASPAEGLGSFFGKIGSLFTRDPVQEAARDPASGFSDANGWSYPDNRF